VDITGVPSVDAAIANHLVQAVCLAADRAMVIVTGCLPRLHRRW
jgi:hypothetical protein